MNTALFIVAILAIFNPFSSAETNEKHDLMPVPESIIFGSGELVIDGTFQIKLTGHTDERLQRLVERIYDRINRQTGIIFSPRPPKGSNVILEVRVASAGKAIQTVEEDESYSLTTNSKDAVIIANTTVGAIRAVETFLQLIEPGKKGFCLPAVVINDSPRFRWRGLLVDACRHWQPKAVILRTLDAMAASKLNVLHWHLSEDQGFRVESRKHPLLHKKGSDGNYYTQDDIREVVDYARDRGIRVMPEFDMPGHTTSWFVGYPELASAPGPYQIQRRFGVHYPVIDPTREEVYEFIDGFIGEMTELFPDEYFHIGGDEVDDKHWLENERIQSFMKENKLADSHALQAYFNKRLLKILQKYNKKMVGWDEIFHADLPKDIVIQSWRGQESLAEAAKQGYRGILSNGYYIDLFQRAQTHYAIDPLSGPVAKISNDEKELILGGEATMWAELITPELIDSRIWPRAAAIAERFWSPAHVTDVDDMYRRLEIHSKRLEYLGLNHRTIQRTICERLVPAGEDAELLITLAQVVEPLKGYRRHRIGDYRTYQPLNRFVDAIPADSMFSRNFNLTVTALLSEEKGWQENKQFVISTLLELNELEAQLRPLIQNSARLKELSPLASYVSDLAGIALQAVEYIEQSKKAPKEWLAKARALVSEGEIRNGQELKLPEYELEVTILPGIKALIERVTIEKDKIVR